MSVNTKKVHSKGTAAWWKFATFEMRRCRPVRRKPFSDIKWHENGEIVVLVRNKLCNYPSTTPDGLRSQKQWFYLYNLDRAKAIVKTN